MGDEYKQTYELTADEFAEYQRLRDGENQRVMGPNSKRVPLLTKVTFNGKNKEEFLSKFSHLAEAYGVADIFFTEYGLHQPGLNHQGRAAWVAKDSTAYLLLERSVSDKIWSLIRDTPDMTARQVFDNLQETCLRTTVRSKTQVEKAMETHRMKDGET